MPANSAFSEGHRDAGLDACALVDARLDLDDLDDEGVELLMAAVRDAGPDHAAKVIAALAELVVRLLRTHLSIQGARHQIGYWRRALLDRPTPPTTTEEHP